MAPAPFHTVSTARLVAMKTQKGRVVSQFGPDAIEVFEMSAAMGHPYWVLSVLNESSDPVNAVYVRPGKAKAQEKDWVVEYRTGTTTRERLATGQVVELSDFGSLDAALSAALLLVVEIPR